MEPGNHQLPRPYLTRAETDERLKILGFQFTDQIVINPPTEMLEEGQEKQFQALQEIIAGALAEWIDVKDDFDEEADPPAIDQELQDWVQEWLVG